MRLPPLGVVTGSKQAPAAGTSYRLVVADRRHGVRRPDAARSEAVAAARAQALVLDGELTS